VLVIEDGAQAVNISRKVCSSKIKTACFVHNNIDCHYKWAKLETNVIVNSSVLNLKTFADWHGTYQCMVECQVRGRVCLVQASTVIALNCTGKHLF